MSASVGMSDTRFAALMEIGLLGLIAVGSCVMAGLSIKNDDASGAAAWSGLLMAIVNTIKEGRSSRTIDRLGGQLAASNPGDPGAATGKPDDPVNTKEVKK